MSCAWPGPSPSSSSGADRRRPGWPARPAATAPDTAPMPARSPVAPPRMLPGSPRGPGSAQTHRPWQRLPGPPCGGARRCAGTLAPAPAGRPDLPKGQSGPCGRPFRIDGPAADVPVPGGGCRRPCRPGTRRRGSPAPEGRMDGQRHGSADRPENGRETGSGAPLQGPGVVSAAVSGGVRGLRGAPASRQRYDSGRAVRPAWPRPAPAAPPAPAAGAARPPSALAARG